ncbi:MAG: hypothetical protein J6X44_10780, partial [Thermoguttaceae bacterium]|nr:hypothetical protein [Thermoguttaceae bacterium]
MKTFFKSIKTVTLISTIALVSVCFRSKIEARETIPFNDGWNFALVAPENYRSEPIRTFEIGDEV